MSKKRGIPKNVNDANQGLKDSGLKFNKPKPAPSIDSLNKKAKAKQKAASKPRGGAF